jgi:hypothetical protein
MRWPWHRTKGYMATVYVPVASSDARPFSTKWSDADFLRSVKAMRGNEVFVVLVSQALSSVREAADSAKSPEELRGCQVGIRELKWLLTAAVEAGARLQTLEEVEDVAEGSGGASSKRRSERTGAHVT